LLFFDSFEGASCFHFEFGTGCGVFFNGFVGLSGNSFGAFGVLFLTASLRRRASSSSSSGELILLSFSWVPR
jgi:hypothetical protein